MQNKTHRHCSRLIYFDFLTSFHPEGYPILHQLSFPLISEHLSLDFLPPIKRPNSLMVFRELLIKATFEVRAAGCMTFFWLFGSEITGILTVNLLVPTSLGSRACAQHVVTTILHVGRGLLSFCRTTQRYASDCYVYLLRKN